MKAICADRLFDYEGPVRNILPYFIFDSERTLIALPCGECSMAQFSLALIGIFGDKVDVVLMRRKSFYFQLQQPSAPFSLTMNGVHYIELRLWMGQCLRCGTVYQSWEVKP